MASRTPTGAIGMGIVNIVKVIALLVVELIITMLVYTYLNLYHLDFFGALVRFARSVLDVMSSQVEYWLQASANTAYATLFGELGPKSILLLLIGLVVAAIVRGLVSLIGRLLTRRETADLGPAPFSRGDR